MDTLLRPSESSELNSLLSLYGFFSVIKPVKTAVLLRSIPVRVAFNATRAGSNPCVAFRAAQIYIVREHFDESQRWGIAHTKEFLFSMVSQILGFIH